MSGYVDEVGRHWDDGFVQMLNDPAHLKITPCEVVDYSAATAELGPPGWQPLLSAQPEPEQPPSRWARLRKAWRGE
jgi:hypothetical protein